MTAQTTYQRIRQLGHRIGERNAIGRAPFECTACGLTAEVSPQTGEHEGQLLIQACSGQRPNPPPEK